MHYNKLHIKIITAIRQGKFVNQFTKHTQKVKKKHTSCKEKKSSQEKTLESEARKKISNLFLCGISIVDNSRVKCTYVLQIVAVILETITDCNPQRVSQDSIILLLW